MHEQITKLVMVLNIQCKCNNKVSDICDDS